MRKTIRPEEEWARRVIEAHLNQPIEHHDDGSYDGMYDLRVGSKEHPEIAIECIRDGDTDTVRVWKKGPANGCFNFEVKGNWLVELTNAARIKAVKAQLGSLLSKVHVLRSFSLELADNECQIGLASDFQKLGVSAVHCLNETGNGRVYFSMSLPGGIADPSGAEVSKWVTRFVHSEKNRDNLDKLSRSGARERQLCIILTLNGTSNGPVLTQFLFGIDDLPTVHPVLPPELTGIWLLIPSGAKGMFFNKGRWAWVDLEMH